MSLEENRFSYSQVQTNLELINILGSDAKTFIGSQSTFDINKLNANEFHLISFLDPQGRIQSYGWLLFKDNTYSYLVPKSLKDISIERLNKFLISEDAEVVAEGVKTVFFTFNDDTSSAPAGLLFDQEAKIHFTDPQAYKLSDDEVEAYRILTGSPSFDASGFSTEIINNTHLFDLALSRNKGCYPGQETVNKIANNRGAAYAPLLLKGDTPFVVGQMKSFDKKIGEITSTTKFEGSYFAEAKLLRDFRVEGLALNFSVEEREFSAHVFNLPYLKGDKKTKSDDLFLSATLHFQKGDIKLAEELFHQSIRMNPLNADAYEALGVMLGRESRFDEAISWMQKLAELDSSSVLAHTNLSMFFMKKGEIEKAEEHKSQATLKSFAQFGREAQEKEKKAQEQQQKQSEWARREEMFHQVLEIDAEDTLANFGLGTLSVEREEYDKAIGHLEAVIRADAKYSAAYLPLGQAYLGAKRKNDALKIWKEGIAIAAAKGDLMPANQMQALLNQNT